jgi:hypothetical protein
MLLLNNDDVAPLLTLNDCIEAIEEAYQEWGLGRAIGGLDGYQPGLFECCHVPGSPAPGR